MRTFIHEGSDLQDDLNLSLARYRFQIFVKQLGWNLPCQGNGIERDKYDRADTVYVTTRDEQGDICGCARLLPTHRPYLSKELFPELLAGDAPAPASPDVWELSRFAAGPAADPAAAGGVPPGAWSRRPEWAVRPLLASVVECAARRGARRLIGVTFASMERLFRRIGVRSQRCGREQNIDGKRVIACWIDIDQQTCRALGIDLAQLEFERRRTALLKQRKWLLAPFQPVPVAGGHARRLAAQRIEHYRPRAAMPFSLGGSSGNMHRAGSSCRPRPATPAVPRSR